MDIESLLDFQGTRRCSRRIVLGLIVGLWAVSGVMMLLGCILLSGLVETLPSLITLLVGWIMVGVISAGSVSCFLKCKSHRD